MAWRCGCHFSGLAQNVCMAINGIVAPGYPGQRFSENPPVFVVLGQPIEFVGGKYIAYEYLGLFIHRSHLVHSADRHFRSAGVQGPPTAFSMLFCCSPIDA